MNKIFILLSFFMFQSGLFSNCFSALSNLYSKQNLLSKDYLYKFLLKFDIANLEFTPQVTNILKKNNIQTIEDLIKYNTNTLLLLHNIGEIKANKIKNHLNNTIFKQKADYRIIDNKDITQETDINELNISVKLLNILKFNNIKTVADLIKYSEQQLLTKNRIGKSTIREIKTMLLKTNFDLKRGRQCEVEKAYLDGT